MKTEHKMKSIPAIRSTDITTKPHSNSQTNNYVQRNKFASVTTQYNRIQQYANTIFSAERIKLFRIGLWLKPASEIYRLLGNTKLAVHSVWSTLLVVAMSSRIASIRPQLCFIGCILRLIAIQTNRINQYKQKFIGCIFHTIYGVQYVYVCEC